MNFIIEIPKTRFKHDAILVVVDKLTKVAHFIPRNLTYDATIISSKFAKEIIRLHGFLEEIVFNRDSRFTSEFWKSLHKAVGTKLNINSAYHPKIDGQTEWVNQVLEDMLRMYCIDHPTK